MNFQLASIGDRFTAQFLDSLVALVVGAAMYFVDWVFIVGKQRRRLGDCLARTRVVRLP
jgi:uncharacterized RDD family membrane protein YckC